MGRRTLLRAAMQQLHMRARTYCEWAGARQPTQAGGEKATRGIDGRFFPWGSAEAGCTSAQYGDCGGATIPVGSTPAGASPCGALDIAGTVWEWVADWCDSGPNGSSPAPEPLGPGSGPRKVLRGGSWGYPAAFLRTAGRARYRPACTGINVGIRCAVTAQRSADRHPPAILSCPDAYPESSAT
jgi:serine/threonine-protein kinase